MKAIWKYQLQLGINTHDIPGDAQILAVQTQGEKLMLWALVDPSATRQPRAFNVYGTGHELSDSPGLYVGTAQMFGGQLVWHVFEVKP